MIKKIIYGVASLILIVVGLLAYLTKNDENVVNVNAEVDLALDCGSAYLIEQTTGKVLNSYNEDVKMYPSSMTKMMGLLLVCEALETNQITLDEMVSISLEAS